MLFSVSSGVVVVLIIGLIAGICMLHKKKAGKRARMDPQAPDGGVTMTTSRTFRGLTDSPSSAHIGPSGVGQPVVGTAVAPTGGAWGNRFDTNTGQPIPKFDPTTGKQNWDA